ncbi:3-phytase [Sodiomyces alkalinus F11]|uniref:3-phytase n=1 Tax=Sodiomyces alkalinus (strain CBS 110278 / VKM F-3762 / F11) TaxID=1314773 RepID=A0A3N2PRN7_SODAK|nr:3-phytase [Sodiomyces alkalinus F11]ROT37182.1 3-phytase [Sodiomyces alkalinus F11]
MSLRSLSISVALSLFGSLAFHPRLTTAAAVELKLNVTAVTPGLIASDWTSVYYSESRPLLITNDGGTATGGVHVWDIDGGSSPLERVKSLNPGRTKLSAVVYDVGGRDVLVSIPQTTSMLSVYELPDVEKIQDAGFFALGDWTALCSWKSGSGNSYLFLFGKRHGVQFLVREKGDSIEIVEIQAFDVPMEFAGCAVSQTHGKLFLTPDDAEEIYHFDLAESTAKPEFSVLGKAEDTVTGVAAYAPKDSTANDYLFVALEDVIAVYQYPFEQIGTIQLTGLEDIEIEALSIYQAPTSKYPNGIIAFAAEAEDFEGFAFSSLEGVLEGLGIEVNTAFHPGFPAGCRKHDPICDACSGHGFCIGGATNLAGCDCFAGSVGESCQAITCQNDCSGHGTCVGPNLCQCDAQWGGLHCSFLVVAAAYETEANGGEDADDPAIWISPVSPERSRIVATTKSEAGQGLTVYDLAGRVVQDFEAGRPNNVDMIYGFRAGNRTVDLAYAACRADNTLCIFEMTPEGILTDIPGGIQPSHVEDAVYGSCVYRSKKTGKQYLFVNEKSGRYRQLELTSTPNGTLETTLVREFVAGAGGQVEGCVADDDNGWLFLGEEPSGLWRYGAEPGPDADADDPPFRIDWVGDGTIWGDVEGVTLVQGKTPDRGFILVSSQGVNAFNVYRRAHPHERVMTFTVAASADGRIDAVTNADGVAAVPVHLGPAFPHGLVVVHDDANELPGGGTDEHASYKLIGLGEILGAEAFRELNLLDEIDPSWDPRA